jgi:hypothetical protein
MHRTTKKKIAIIFSLSVCIVGVFLIHELYSAVKFENAVEYFVVRHIIDWHRQNSPEVELRDDYMIVSHDEHWQLTVGKVVLLERRSVRAWKWDWQKKTLTEVAEGNLNSLTRCHRSWQFYTLRLTPHKTEVVIDGIYPRCNTKLPAKASTTWWILDHKNEPWLMSQKRLGGNSHE